MSRVQLLIRTEGNTAKPEHNKNNTLQAVAAVCIRSGIDRFYLLQYTVVGLVPCYPVCRLSPAFVNHTPPRETMRQTIQNNKQSRLVHPPTTKQDLFRNKDKKEGSREKKTRRINAQKRKKQKKEKGRPRWNELQQLAARVASTCSTDYYCSRPDALLPCLRSPSYFRLPRFPLHSSCCPPCPHSLGRVSFHSSCCPPSPHSLGQHPRRMRGAAYSAVSCALSSCHYTMNRSAASRNPRHQFRAFFAAAARSLLQTPRGSVPLILRWLGTLPNQGLRPCLHANSYIVH